MSQPAWRNREELSSAGWSKAVVDNEIRRGRAVSPVRGVLLPASAAGALWQRCGAALSTQHPSAAITRRTAAIAHNFAWLPDGWRSSRDLCVDAPREDLTRSSRVGLDRRLSALPPEDVTLWDGLRIATEARTAVDLARYEPRYLAVPIIDWLLTEKRCTREELVAVMDRMVRVPWVRRARSFVDQSRQGAASPRETHTRLQIVAAGLPEPDVNLEIKRADRVLAQGDLGYWRWLIWIEYDGEEFHAERRFTGDDQRKDRWLGDRGWDVFRLTNDDHYRPGPFLQQLGNAIRCAPARVAALDPGRSPEVAAAHLALGLGWR